MKITVARPNTYAFGQWLSDVVKMELFLLHGTDGRWYADIGEVGCRMDWTFDDCSAVLPEDAVKVLISKLHTTFGPELKLELTPATIAQIEEATQ